MPGYQDSPKGKLLTQSCMSRNLRAWLARIRKIHPSTRNLTTQLSAGMLEVPSVTRQRELNKWGLHGCGRWRTTKTESVEPMSLHDFVRAVGKSWLAIVILACAGASIGYVYSSSMPEKFRSNSSVMVTTGLGSTAQELVQGSTYIEKLVASYALLARSEIVLDPVIEELGLDTTVPRLAGSITASSTLNTVIIDISAVAGDPTAAQELAEAVTKNLATAVEDVSPRDAEGESTVRLTLIESASTPAFRFEPNTRLWALLGGLVGIGSGVIFALLRRYFADVLGSPSDLADVTDVPLLGEIPEARRGQPIPQTVLINPSSVESEAFSALSANLNFVAIDGGLRSLVVTSGSPEEGKSTTALTLAISMAESSRRVLLIDADLRNPSIATMTGLDGEVGLTSVLVQEVTLDGAAQLWGVPGLSVLTSGSSAPNPAQLLRSDTLGKLIATASSHYDMVIVDSAPILSVTDAVWLGHMTDGVIILARRGRTKVRSFTRTLTALADAKVPVIGVVLSRVARKSRAAYGNDYLVSTRRRTQARQ